MKNHLPDNFLGIAKTWVSLLLKKGANQYIGIIKSHGNICPSQRCYCLAENKLCHIKLKSRNRLTRTNVLTWQILLVTNFRFWASVLLVWDMRWTIPCQVRSGCNKIFPPRYFYKDAARFSEKDAAQNWNRIFLSSLSLFIKCCFRKSKEIVGPE